MIHTITLTQHDETRNPPAGRVVELQADLQGVTIRVFEDIDDDAPTTQIKLARAPLIDSLRILLDQVDREEVRIAALEHPA